MRQPLDERPREAVGARLPPVPGVSLTAAWASRFGGKSWLGHTLAVTFGESTDVTVRQSPALYGL